ncbi:MAG: histidine--tRNA ligase [Candidatus Methanomethyliaceae archaeon]|nr:histidine--tRNA ligase [Candidatus Methanomethyliaceae archaeon]MDW7971151.1 histidine--tRNA ligase [Nitrososphaerota archaeon]
MFRGNMKFGRPRGTRDFLPDEMRVRSYIIEKVRRAFEMHGFEEMDTPAIELWEVLSAKGGEEVEHQIYKFQDKGGRWIGLRFDLTVPLARVVANNPDLVKPFKRYCIAKVWRYEEPQSGRFREFLQADIDIVGSPYMEADVECIATAIDALKSLNLERFKVRINNRKILEGVMSLMGISGELFFKILRILDKMDKIGENQVIKELEDLGLEREIIEKIINFIHNKGEEALDYIKRNFESDLVIQGVNELEKIIALSKPYNLYDYIVIDLSLVRGLDYYTGPVFEIEAEERQIGSIAGGGRYDNLIEKFGGSAAYATGISLGIERLYEILGEKIAAKINKSNTKVFIANVNEELLEESIKIYRRIIEFGIPAEIDLMRRKLSRQLEYANAKKIPYVLIIGPEELKSGIFKLRDMMEKKEYNIKLEELKNFILSQAF